MVYAFIIQTVGTQHAPRILFSQRFSDQSFCAVVNDSESENVNIAGDATRETLKEALEVICKRISVEYNFASSVAIRNVHDSERLHHPGILPELNTGMFYMSKDQPPYYSTDKHTIWCGAMGLVFALVIESEENRGLASIVLKYITKYVDDYIQAFDRHKEVLLKPHVVIHIVSKLLPQGQLLFMNHKVIKQLEKELEQLITSL